ncbi:PLP-dependent aminotransferase family protein [Limnohabitans sp.]|uniref:MocR-like pyridoxine biosynthesis transcription factor PdxR n=1 Tax=Limnohabitans sp. TaxID=1907725 RepID=UPI00286FA1B8|nr:PLP-dependent aminotransferase family protein [Limnohabitans sp.]
MLTDFITKQMQAWATNPKPPELTLNRQLYLLLKQAIQEKNLRAGECLPSSRSLAQDLGLARNTVMSAMSQLEAEGFLETRQGSGTYVRYKLPAHVRLKGKKKTAPSTSDTPRAISKRGTHLLKQAMADELEIQPFTQGFPDFSPFPLTLWQRLQNKHWRLSYADMLDYNDTGGFMPLKRAIAQYLRMSRNMSLEDEQVIITTGTQQSLSLCATLLSDPDDTVWVEDPLYWGAAQTFRASGLCMHGIPTDIQGLNIAHSEHAPTARMIYVTPSHQYPTGGILSLERRHTLLQRCHDMQAWVLEDDYDSEFRFAGQAMSSLHGLDVHDRVFYMGTFSKALYPGIKMAYLVVPLPWVQAFKRAHYDLHRPGLMHQQVAMAEFIELGHFHTTIRNARQHYEERRQALLQALTPCLGRHASISGAEQGLHLCVHLPPHVDDVALAQLAHTYGLTVRALSRYTITRKNLRGLVIGYGYAPLAAIQQDGLVLAELILRNLQQTEPAPVGRTS